MARDGVQNAAEQQEAFLDQTQPQQSERKTKFGNFLHFLYNREAGTVLGRTGISWLEITIFYIIFYSALIAFWAICLYIFLQTLDDRKPRYYGKGTIIGVNPGIGYQPWLRDDPDSTLIFFDPDKESTYKKYTDALDKFLEKYANTSGTKACEGKTKPKEGEPCTFRLNGPGELGPDFSECSKENAYGFKEGKPCVVITVNRLIGWEPVPYPTHESVPDIAKQDYEPGDIPIRCEGEYYADHENLGVVKYIPKSGIPGKFFPFMNPDNYQTPLAFIKFETPPKGVLVEIECKAYAYNIIHDTFDRQGMVHFELLVDNKRKS